MIRLSNGVELPSIGLGTFKATGESVQVAVKAAVQCGITHIDTAAIYKVRRRLHGAPAPTRNCHVTVLVQDCPGSSWSLHGFQAHHFALKQLARIHAGCSSKWL
jgi:hypothetical protein